MRITSHMSILLRLRNRILALPPVGTPGFDPIRVLGIDVGARRTGLALSDDRARIASPLYIIEASASPYNTRAWIHEKKDGKTIHTPSFANVYSQVESLSTYHNVSAIVLGFPLHKNGREGIACLAVKAFADGYERWCSAHESPPPLVMWDERKSTMDARYQLSFVGGKKKTQNAPIDDKAASLVLQDFLDTLYGEQNDDIKRDGRDVMFDDVDSEKEERTVLITRRRLYEAQYERDWRE